MGVRAWASAKTRSPKNFSLLFIQNCQRSFFSRSPKGLFYTVYTHYCHSLLMADPVTHIFPAAGPPSLDVPPTCHPSVWSSTKEEHRDRGRQSSANPKRDVSKYDSVISVKGMERIERERMRKSWAPIQGWGDFCIEEMLQCAFLLLTQQ